MWNTFLFWPQACFLVIVGGHDSEEAVVDQTPLLDLSDSDSVEDECVPRYATVVKPTKPSRM